MKVIFNKDNDCADDILATLNCAVEYLSQPQCIQCEVNFVSTTQIKRLNRLYRNIDKATDVLSFPMLDIERGTIIDKQHYALDIDSVSGNVMIGEIYISTTIAKQQAVEYQHSLTREICFLALHGLLHLLGYDHIEEQQRVIMEQKQDIIMKKVGIIN